SAAGFGVLEQPAMATAASGNATFKQAIFMAVLRLSWGRKLGAGSFLRRRTAPAGQIIGVHALGQLQCLLERALEVALDQFAFHAPAQKICPDEFAERRRVLGVTADTAQFASQRAVRVVYQHRDRLGK